MKRCIVTHLRILGSWARHRVLLYTCVRRSSCSGTVRARHTIDKSSACIGSVMFFWVDKRVAGTADAGVDDCSEDRG